MSSIYVAEMDIFHIRNISLSPVMLGVYMDFWNDMIKDRVFPSKAAGAGGD